MRNTMKNFTLGVALIAGLLGTGAVAANAAPQEFRGRPEARNEARPEARFDRGDSRGYDRRAGGREYAGREYAGREYAGRGYDRPVGGAYFGGPVVDAYIPPCPGDGYIWNAGYYDGGLWVPGAWGFRGRVGFDRGYGRGYHENRFVAERRGGGFERGFHGRR